MSYAHFFFFVSLWARQVVFLKRNKTKLLTHEENYYFGQNSIFISKNFYFKSKLVKSIFYIFIVNSYFLSKIIEYRCATQMCDKGV